MAQELIDKIRAQAQAKGIDPDVAVQIARAESSLRPGVGATTSSAGGLFGVIDSTWKEFGGAPGKKFDPDENIRVGTAVIAQNTNYLKKILNRDPRPAEVYAAHYFGPAGAKSFLQAAPDTPILDILGKKAINANPNLKGKTAQEVMAQLERKMGTTSAKSAPDVSRETRPSAPGPTPAEQMMEPALRSGMTAQAPIGDKFSDLGAGYQAALALSFLSDTDDKEDRDIDREPGIAEQWLAQQAPRSTALAEIADITIKSPFAEPPKPLALAHGGEVAHLAMGGFPYMPTARITSSARKQLDDIKAQYDTYNTQADLYNKQADTYQADMDAYNAAAEAYNAGDRSSEFSRTEPVAPTAPVAPSVTPEQYDAMAKKAAKNVAGRNLALQVAADPEQFNFSMDRLFADGGEVEKGEAQQALEKYLQSRDEMPDIKVTGNLPEGTNGMFTSDNLNIGSGTIKIHKNTPKAALSSLLAHELTHAADRQMRQQAIEQGMFGNSNQYTEAYKKLVGPDGQNRTQLARNLKPEWAAENRLYRADPKEIAAYGVGAFAGPTLQGPGPRHVDATAATELRILMDLAQRNVDKGPKGLEKIPAFFRKMGRYADGGEVQLTPQQIEQIAMQQAMEREIASKPAFLTPKSGIGRKISTKTGELEGAALQGVSEMPYNLLGAPVDLATIAMRPFGYDVEKPVGGSEDLKQRALEAGIRQKPPEGAAARALYELTQAGASAVNPAAPVRGAVAAAEKTGEAAKMLARDFQQYNRQLSVPGASYAVRNRGTPFMMTYGNNLTEGPDGKFLSMDQPEGYVRDLANTNDYRLNQWFSNKITPYLRRDFASPEDQFVKAAEEGKLLHMAKKPTKRDEPESASQYDRRMNLQGTRKLEGFPEEGVATTPYGKRVEAQIDESAWPLWLEDITSPGLVPPSMRGMVETNPSARVTELGSNIDKKLKLEDLRDGMLEMRQMGPEFSAYGQAPVKVPEQYRLTDEALIGLTPAQASNRVATFRNWRDENRQRMASKYAKEDPSLDRMELPGGITAVRLPDLQSSPNVKQLALDVGCDGNWCTRREASALDYGSGNNRLHIFVDKKARPLAQITFSRFPPTKKQLEADPSAGDKFSITEMLGKDNSSDFSQNPALPALQQYIKNLDRQHGLAYVANLDKIGMREMDNAALIQGAKELSNLRYRPGISREEFMAGWQRDLIDLETAIYEINGGSKYLTKDQDMDSLVKQAVDRLSPQQRATGGMIERQSTDSRKYL